jgi:hypothetical protein
MTTSNPDCIFRRDKPKSDMVLADDLIYAIRAFIDDKTYTHLINQAKKMTDIEIIKWLAPIVTAFQMGIKIAHS